MSEKTEQVEISVEDCKRLAVMLNVHVRPVYFKGALGKSDASPMFCKRELARCDRLFDLFSAAAGVELSIERTEIPDA